jgi:predicted dehydrogenase
MKKVRVGIIGTGMIGKIFASESKVTENCEVVAIVSRSEATGKAFADTYGIEKVYTDYNEMVKDPDIDAVYIATPHPKHKEHTIAALNAKKAVLCEKPFAMTYVEAKEMVDCAKENGVLLMEAMWTRFLPATQKMKALINEGAIGDILFVKSDFGFRVPHGYDVTGRLLNPELGGGALYDAGIYPVSMARHVTGKNPVAMTCGKMVASTGVDAMSTYNFTYDDGSMALLYSAVCVETEKQLFVSGTKGTLLIPNFWKADEVTFTQNGGSSETFSYQHKDLGYDNEITAFCNSYMNGELENSMMPLAETLEIMKTMDEIYSKIS